VRLAPPLLPFDILGEAAVLTPDFAHSFSKIADVQVFLNQIMSFYDTQSGKT